MNILDWIVIIIIAFTTLTGIYRGFIHSALSLISFFISWLCSALFTPAVSRAFVKNDLIYSFIYNYTEGSERLTNFEYSKLMINEIPANEINQMVTDSNLPTPFSSLIESNIAEEVFSKDGFFALGDYYNLTITNVFINIISFFIIFVIAKLVFSFIINSLNYTLKFPILRMYDSTVGGFFGFLTGIFVTYAVFILTPLILAIQPIQEIYDIVYDSLFASFFYTSNFILNFIRGVI